MAANVRTIKVFGCVAATACLTAANVWTANAAIIETYFGAGNFNTPGSAAQTARNEFLARLISATVTSNVFNVNALQDNHSTGANMTFAAYSAGTGNYGTGVFGSVVKGELNRGTGFIFVSGTGLNLFGSGLTGGWGTTMGAENRYPPASPAITANRGGYIGIAPIEGQNGGYTLLAGYLAFGVSVGSNLNGGVGPIELSYFDLDGNYLGYNTVNLSGGRAYIGVISSVPLGAVILGGPGFIAGSEAQASGFHAFDFGTIPEPATGVVVLLGVGLCGMRRIGRRR